jgi:hypothetical protein
MKPPTLTFSLNLGKSHDYLESLYTGAIAMAAFEEAARIGKLKTNFERAVKRTAVRYAELLNEKIDDGAGMALASGNVFNTPLRHLYAGGGALVGDKQSRLFKIQVKEVKSGSFKLNMKFLDDGVNAYSDTTGSNKKIKVDSIGRRRFGTKKNEVWVKRAQTVMAGATVESRLPHQGWYVVGASPMPNGINFKVPKVIKVAPRFKKSYAMEARHIREYIDTNYRVNGQNLLYALDKAALMGLEDVINAGKSKSYSSKSGARNIIGLTSKATRKLPPLNQNVSEALMSEHLAKIFIKSFARESYIRVEEKVKAEVTLAPTAIQEAASGGSGYLGSKEMDGDDDDSPVQLGDSSMAAAYADEEGGWSDDDPDYDSNANY